MSTSGVIPWVTNGFGAKYVFGRSYVLVQDGVYGDGMVVDKFFLNHDGGGTRLGESSQSYFLLPCFNQRYLWLKIDEARNILHMDYLNQDGYFSKFEYLGFQGSKYINRHVVGDRGPDHFEVLATYDLRTGRLKSVISLEGDDIYGITYDKDGTPTIVKGAYFVSKKG